MKLSERINRIQPSATLTIEGRAKELKQAGRDIISLSAGEPDFAAPDTARNAGIEAIREGFTHYTLVGGILPLREAICAYLEKNFHLSYTPDQILVGCGAKSVLFHLFMILLDPGDEVVIPSPYWVSYPDQVLLAGGKPVILPTREEDGFVPTAQALRQALTPKTKLLVLNAPANPSGAVLERKDLLAIATVLKEFPQVTIISDEIYAAIVYDGFWQDSIAHVAPELKERCVVVNGMSKVYAMTGWRIGYAAGPLPIIKGLGKIQGQSTSNPSSIAQRAALGALQGDQGVVQEMVKAFWQRRDHMFKILADLPEITCVKPRGAFYCFPNFSAYFGRKTPAGKSIGNSIDMASFLLEEMGVALVPGDPFGSPPNLRLSFATSIEQIEKGLTRVRQGLERLVPQ